MRDADLKIDVDTHRRKPIRRFNFRFRMLCSYFPGFRGSLVRAFRTRKGYHFYVYLPRGCTLPPVAIIAVQAILGSDWLRELRNWDRVNMGDRTWNVLFGVKIKNGKVQNERYVTSYRIGGKNAKGF